MQSVPAHAVLSVVTLAFITTPVQCVVSPARQTVEVSGSRAAFIDLGKRDQGRLGGDADPTTESPLQLVGNQHQFAVDGALTTVSPSSLGSSFASALASYGDGTTYEGGAFSLTATDEGYIDNVPGAMDAYRRTSHAASVAKQTKLKAKLEAKKAAEEIKQIVVTIQHEEKEKAAAQLAMREQDASIKAAQAAVKEAKEKSAAAARRKALREAEKRVSEARHEADEARKVQAAAEKARAAKEVEEKKALEQAEHAEKVAAKKEAEAIKEKTSLKQEASSSPQAAATAAASVKQAGAAATAGGVTQAGSFYNCKTGLSAPDNLLPKGWLSFDDCRTACPSVFQFNSPAGQSNNSLQSWCGCVKNPNLEVISGPQGASNPVTCYLKSEGTPPALFVKAQPSPLPTLFSAAATASYSPSPNYATAQKASYSPSTNYAPPQKAAPASLLARGEDSTAESYQEKAAIYPLSDDSSFDLKTDTLSKSVSADLSSTSLKDLLNKDKKLITPTKDKKDEDPLVGKFIEKTKLDEIGKGNLDSLTEHKNNEEEVALDKERSAEAAKAKAEEAMRLHAEKLQAARKRMAFLVKMRKKAEHTMREAALRERASTAEENHIVKRAVAKGKEQEEKAALDEKIRAEKDAQSAIEKKERSEKKAALLAKEVLTANARARKAAEVAAEAAREVDEAASTDTMFDMTDSLGSLGDVLPDGASMEQETMDGSVDETVAMMQAMRVNSAETEAQISAAKSAASEVQHRMQDLEAELKRRRAQQQALPTPAS
eukprot:TRINITY_DN817_c0_g1_i5.p1 TRINITY_DN817_c0_g1~~TRINITY_DN817_c0_g1_i5.p1  ORF type:complete len:773 (+),score=211.96 TRINITY_DN817_c0_g1_i5:76-2394(+)